MKTIKKLLALTLVLCMVFCLSVAVFASAEEPTPAPGEVGWTPTSDQETVTITKVYKLVGAGASPAETFTLEQVGDGEVKDGDADTAPHLGTITGATFSEGAATADGATGSITIALPTYTNVGVYEYKLKEVVPSGTTKPTAGVTYYADEILLRVTVVEGANGKLRVAAVHTETLTNVNPTEGKTKYDTFPNVYSAGTLKVSKTVQGNIADKDKYFEFKVTLTGDDTKAYATSFAVTGGSTAANNPQTIEIGQETTFKLKHGDTISIANIPYGVTYSVTETAVDGYTTTKTGDTGTINAAEQTAAFTNTKEGTIDMGVTLDSLPYILALAVVFGGAVVMVSRKRHVED